MITILFIVLLALVVGALPRWPHSRRWGYYPMGSVGLILLVLVFLVVSNRL